MKFYETTHLVKSEDLNHHGTLYAARMASWFVEAAFLAVACEHGEPCEIVCRNIHGMSLKKPVSSGSLVKLSCRIAYAGKTSLTVYTSAVDILKNEIVVEGFITFVLVSPKTKKTMIHGIHLDETAVQEEQEQRKLAETIRSNTGG